MADEAERKMAHMKISDGEFLKEFKFVQLINMARLFLQNRHLNHGDKEAGKLRDLAKILAFENKIDNSEAYEQALLPVCTRMSEYADTLTNQTKWFLKRDMRGILKQIGRHQHIVPEGGFEIEKDEAIKLGEKDCFYKNLGPISLKDEFDGLRVLEELGQGSFGAVFRVKDDENGETYALKMMKRYAGDDLQKEIDLVRTFESEYVVKCIGVLITPFEVGVFMELGIGDLRGGVLPAEEVLNVLHDCASGGKYMHDVLGVVHRDIKLDNILKFKKNGKIIYKIADFSLATVNDTIIRNTRCGTPGYQAPEILQINPVYSFLCDVYSLAVSAYLLLTGDLTGVHLKSLEDFGVSRTDKIAREITLWMLETNPNLRPTMAQILHLPVFTGEHVAWPNASTVVNERTKVRKEFLTAMKRIVGDHESMTKKHLEFLVAAVSGITSKSATKRLEVMVNDGLIKLVSGDCQWDCASKCRKPVIRKTGRRSKHVLFL